MAPSKTFFNHYETLRLGREATSSDIKRAAVYERLWASELKTYFASGWEKKPPKAYNPPKPPQVIRGEKAAVKIDRLLYRYHKHLAELKAENSRLFKKNVKLQERLENSGKVLDEMELTNCLLQKRKVTHYGERLTDMFTSEEQAHFDKKKISKSRVQDTIISSMG
ncbi:MAG: hypothetical protein L6R41_003207 [Letrouitia leprolyta]|nr:MAG: hypothetical protein L6R41_003207 [Letrouitia leprolyta]